MAPGNPYVNYVMGMIYLMAKQAVLAKPYLEKSVSLDPKQPPSLYALGTARFQLADYQGAVQALEQDVRLETTAYKAEWLLAYAYLKLRNYEKARDYAEAAMKNGKQNAYHVQVLLAEAFAGLGERERAADTFEDYLRQNPRDPNAERIRGYVETLRRPLAPEAVPMAANVAMTVGSSADESRNSITTPAGIPASIPTTDLPPKENWAPPDLDDVKPYLISSASCSLPNILQAAENNAVQFGADIQKFSAVEQFQSVEIKTNQKLEKPETRMFDYLVFIENPRPGLIHVEEERDSRLGETGIPGPLHDEGAPARVLVFHPSFRNDFNWKCEGLGEWKGKPAWIVHFAQTLDNPTSLRMLAGLQTSSGLYAMPLKGRAWISENGGHVMHLETDLTHPMPALGLMRQHFAIEYAPVSFQSHKVQLWLPESVDVYYQYRGHFFHNYHHYSNFKLFWVGTSEKMGKPKETEQLQ